MSAHTGGTNYVAVWAWLLVLMAAGFAASFLPGARGVAVAAIFAVAVVKALIVAAYFMHLRVEPRVIYAIALVPVAIVLVLTLALLPDFAAHH
ncbi:MAG TPA: cytochrome C oxidase subunit IV family protein [Thermodesulfobacteriota bacterium]